MKRKQYRRLTYLDRQTIEKMYKNKSKIQDIANAIDVTRQTIYRELERGMSEDDCDYSATKAQLSLGK